MSNKDTVHYLSGKEGQLRQLHHEFKDGVKTVRTEMIVQYEYTTFEAERKLVAELHISHPLPKGAIWMICNERSEYFAKVEAE